MAVSAVKVELFGDSSRGAVTIESDLPKFPDQIEELGSSRAREFVLASAVREGIKGMPGISRMSDPPYPVNSAGETIENLKDDAGNPLPFSDPRAKPKAYRASYEVTARQ